MEPWLKSPLGGICKLALLISGSYALFRLARSMREQYLLRRSFGERVGPGPPSR